MRSFRRAPAPPLFGHREGLLGLDQALILFHKKRHPAEMGADEVRQFLTHLAVEGHAAASAQNVALCALLFLYRDVLGAGRQEPAGGL